jgi:glucose uptake protein GlcU
VPVRGEHTGPARGADGELFMDALEEGPSQPPVAAAPAHAAPAHPALVVDDDEEEEEEEETGWAAYKRRVFGVLLALLAGSTCGLNAVPFDIWTNTVREEGVSPLTFVFSQALGAYAASTFGYLLYGLVAMARRVHVEHSPVRPAYLAGAMWGTGLAAQFVAIEELGMAEAYVICAIGPVMVSALVSAFVFGEIEGADNVRDFTIALALQTTGVVMLALGS